MRVSRSAAFRRWCLSLGVLPAVVLLFRVGTVGLAGVASAQRGGAQAGGQARGNPLMPPDRELAMKVKGSFTFAGVGDIIIRHPFAQLTEPGFQNLIKHLKDADVG